MVQYFVRLNSKVIINNELLDYIFMKFISDIAKQNSLNRSQSKPKVNLKRHITS